MQGQTFVERYPLIPTIAQVAAVWILSVIGYYLFLPSFGIDISYNGNPVPITAYYITWTIIAIFAFFDIFHKRQLVENRRAAYLVLLSGSAFVAAYLAYVLPALPSITWTPSWVPPSEILSATSWYFLPKSIEIFLQQILLLAMVITFEKVGYSLRTTSVWCAALFGGGHLFLVLGGGGFIYVTTFTIIAVVASFIFPYLLLKARNGFLYSYFLHWGFYAVAIVLTRFVFNV